ncbi:DUF2510 domain-containing protein [Microbacterium chocolatum]|uniref:DUF2510 domain-containing protein n=1 Tax=Microbacterium aurantiacum TaxID=162393 RepID=UPI0033904881
MSDNSNNNTDQSADGSGEPQLPPAAWYPDPHDSGAQRYWDGAQWTSHTAPTSADAATAATTPATATPAATVSAAGGSVAVAPRRGLRKLKWWQWALIALAALVLISMIASAISGGSADDAEGDDPATVAEVAEEVPAEEPEPIDDREEVPALVGLTVAEARAALEEAGFVIATPDGTGDDWVVATQTLSEGRQADAGTEVLVTAEAPKPAYTLVQENAIAKAKSYLLFAGFSRTGPIEQLEFEGFTDAEIQFDLAAIGY